MQLDEYIFLNGERVARRDASNNVFYYFEDQIGTNRVITNSAGTICYDADFFPFGGEQYVYTNTCPQNYKFTGKERDPETGLDYFGARYYSSGWARFMTPDWAAAPTTVPYAKFGDPQSLNLYGYVENEPVNRIDADGHCDVGCAISIALGVASGILRDGGMKQYLKNVGIGVLKGTGSAMVNAVKLGAAASAGANAGAAAAALMTPGPRALQPSNATQAQASIVTQAVFPAAAGVAGAAAEAASTTLLYRAVMPAEAESIEATGAFNNPAGVESKYFSTSLEGAQDYASQATAAFGDGPFSFYSTGIPTSAITPEMTVNVDGGINTVVVSTDDLPKLQPPTAVEAPR